MELLVLLVAILVIALDIYGHGGFRSDGKLDEVPDYTNRLAFAVWGVTGVLMLACAGAALTAVVTVGAFGRLGALLGDLLMAGVAFAISGYNFKRMRLKASLVRSAQLHTSAMPLAPGSEVKLTFTRELKKQVELGTVTGELVLLQLMSKGFGRQKITFWSEVFRHALEAPRARIKHGMIIASWTVSLPEYDPRKGHWFGWLWSSEKFRWELRVDTPVSELDDLSSIFRIPFMFPMLKLGTVPTPVLAERPSARLESKS